MFSSWICLPTWRGPLRLPHLSRHPQRWFAVFCCFVFVLELSRLAQVLGKYSGLQDERVISMCRNMLAVDPFVFQSSASDKGSLLVSTASPREVLALLQSLQAVMLEVQSVTDQILLEAKILQASHDEGRGSSLHAYDKISSVLGKVSSNIKRQCSGHMNLYMGESTVLCYSPPLGLDMYLDSRDHSFTPHICRGREWEGELTRFLQATVKEGMHVVDIGASFGWYTMLLSGLVKESGAVLAVEPHPRAHRLLEQTLSLAGLGFVQLINRVCLSKDDQDIRLSDNLAWHIGNHPVDTGDGPIVKSVKLDTLINDVAWPRVDLVKCDAEGFEDMIWEGMQGVVDDNPGLTLVMEIHLGRLLDRKVDIRSLLESMESRFGGLQLINRRSGQVEKTCVEDLGTQTTTNLLLYLHRKI